MDDKQHINRQPTSAVEQDRDEAFDVGGDVRRRGEDPSPDDRKRGERSGRDPAGTEDARRR